MSRPARLRLAGVVLVLGLLACPREYMLPVPEPMPDNVTGGLSPGARRRLADIRRFLSPYDQQVLEHSLANLAGDPHLERDATLSAVERAISGSGVGVAGVSGFCERLAAELEPLRLAGPPADAPAAVAYAATIDRAYEEWLSEPGRERHTDARALARAVRDGALAPGDVDAAHVLESPPGGVLFVTDAAAFDTPGSAAHRLCLSAPPAHSFVVAILPAAALTAPLRVPTAADAVCRARFEPPPEGATRGTNCSGHPEYVTAPTPLGAARELRLSR